MKKRKLTFKKEKIYIFTKREENEYSDVLYVNFKNSTLK